MPFSRCTCFSSPVGGRTVAVAVSLLGRRRHSHLLCRQSLSKVKTRNMGWAVKLRGECELLSLSKSRPHGTVWPTSQLHAPSESSEHLPGLPSLSCVLCPVQGVLSHRTAAKQSPVHTGAQFPAAGEEELRPEKSPACPMSRKSASGRAQIQPRWTLQASALSRAVYHSFSILSWAEPCCVCREENIQFKTCS